MTDTARRAAPFDTPLASPLPGASLPQAVGRFFRKYATFSGRASRSEYWWWALASTLVYIVVGGIGVAVGVATQTPAANGRTEPGPGFLVFILILVVFWLATVVPSIALAVRRLHDANLAGWFYLLGLIPSVGGIILLVFALLPSRPEGARFD